MLGGGFRKQTNIVLISSKTNNFIAIYNQHLVTIQKFKTDNRYDTKYSAFGIC